jgi:hypothetical protein
VIDSEFYLNQNHAVKKKLKDYPIETAEPSAATKRALRDSMSGRGVTLIGKTPEEVRAWSRRVYASAFKNKKI